MLAWKRQNIIFISLLIGIFILIGLLSVRYDSSIDITIDNRNKLSEQSIKVVQRLSSPLKVIAFVRGNPKVKKLINRLIDKYRDYADIKLSFKNPDTAIDLVSKYNITRDGELLFEYKNRHSYSGDLSETSITQAIYELLNISNRKVLFVTGHGERSLGNEQNGYGALFENLKNINIKVGQVDLRMAKKVPDDINLLAIADAKSSYDETEIKKIEDYLSKGGNLLWLGEYNSSKLSWLKDKINISILSKIIINQKAKKYNIDNPSYIVIEPDSKNTIVLNKINTMLLFPKASPVTSLSTNKNSKWKVSPILSVLDDSFYKDGENISKANSPINIGMLLTSLQKTNRQKIFVIGDADFLSNQFIGFGQNNDFASNLFSLLTSANNLVVKVKEYIPPAVIISSRKLGYLSLIFIVIIPFLILLFGLLIRSYIIKKI